MPEQPQRQRRLSRNEKLFAGILITLFLLMVPVMFYMRADAHWDRLLVPFGALEAFALLAAGALFGTSVQRNQTADAQELADTAIADAKQIRKQLDEARRLANMGESLRILILQKNQDKANRIASGKVDLTEDGKLALTANLLQRDFDELVELASSSK